MTMDDNPTVTTGEALHAEDLRYAAQMSGDIDALEGLYADDLVYLHSSGVIDSKATFIELLRSGTVRFRRMTRHEAAVRTYGPVAIITGRGSFEVTARGQAVTLEQLFHSVWVKRQGVLRFTSWQATRLVPKA